MILRNKYLSCVWVVIIGVLLLGNSAGLKYWNLVIGTVYGVTELNTGFPFIYISFIMYFTIASYFVS